MKFSEYNSYPDDMRDMDSDAWNDFFTYCVEEHESRQAYKESIFELHEDLRISWVKKDKNLGFCIGRKNNATRFYRIGSDKAWEEFKSEFAANFAHDNS